jgi:hypothetical protein
MSELPSTVIRFRKYISNQISGRRFVIEYALFSQESSMFIAPGQIDCRLWSVIFSHCYTNIILTVHSGCLSLARISVIGTIDRRNGIVRRSKTVLHAP